MSNSNMANREVCDLIFVDYSTRKPFLNLDFANVTTTELTGESVFAYGGKGHPKKVQFAGEKGGTMTIETQVQTVKLWQLITGGETSAAAKFVTRTETTVDADGTGITLSDVPVAGTVVVYATGDDCGTELMDISFLNEFMVPIVAGICLCVGYVLKNIVSTEKINRFIPLVMGVLGVALNWWIQGTFSAEILLGGLFSGLSCTGLHQIFKQMTEQTSN